MRMAEYVASPFLQLYDGWFTEAALENLSKTLVAVGLVKNGSFGFGHHGSDGAASIIFCISVHTSSGTNRNIFSLLEWIKSLHKILLMFAITICGALLLMKRRNSSGNIIWNLSFSCSLAFLSLRSWPWSCERKANDIALREMMISVLTNFSRNFSTLKQMIQLKL